MIANEIVLVMSEEYCSGRNDELDGVQAPPIEFARDFLKSYIAAVPADFFLYLKDFYISYILTREIFNGMMEEVSGDFTFEC